MASEKERKPEAIAMARSCGISESIAAASSSKVRPRRLPQARRAHAQRAGHWCSGGQGARRIGCKAHQRLAPSSAPPAPLPTRQVAPAGSACDAVETHAGSEAGTLCSPLPRLNVGSQVC